jgi:DNA processing protein
MSDPTRYYLGFSLVNGIGPARLERLIAHCGSAEAAWQAGPFELAAAGLEPRLIGELQRTRRSTDLDAALERAAQLGIRLICREHPDYPAPLHHIPLPPPLIYVRGQLLPGDAWGIAVVGTRSPTSYGREATQRLTAELAAAGATVISGLAIGIDSVAHGAALEAGGRTVAVLASGADLIYPERHTRLAERICEAGAIVSEFPIGTRPLPQLFPVRNRLISGLARAVVVVEARPGSGALITVDYALEQGREVFAVPGPIYSQASAGPHHLLRQGAGLATSAADILEALGMGNIEAQHEARASLPDDPAERALLMLLAHEPQHIDALRRDSGLPIDQVSATLAMLELKGFARQAGPMEYVRI